MSTTNPFEPVRRRAIWSQKNETKKAEPPVVEKPVEAPKLDYKYKPKHKIKTSFEELKARVKA